mgnify:CR=1 FL=1
MHWGNGTNKPPLMIGDAPEIQQPMSVDDGSRL